MVKVRVEGHTHLSLCELIEKLFLSVEQRSEKMGQTKGHLVVETMRHELTSKTNLETLRKLDKQSVLLRVTEHFLEIPSMLLRHWNKFQRTLFGPVTSTLRSIFSPFVQGVDENKFKQVTGTYQDCQCDVLILDICKIPSLKLNETKEDKTFRIVISMSFRICTVLPPEYFSVLLQGYSTHVITRFRDLVSVKVEEPVSASKNPRPTYVCSSLKTFLKDLFEDKKVCTTSFLFTLRKVV